MAQTYIKNVINAERNVLYKKKKLYFNIQLLMNSPNP